MQVVGPRQPPDLRPGDEVEAEPRAAGERPPAVAMRVERQRGMPPQGEDAIKWVGTLTPAFLAAQPKPGSYK